MRHSPEFLDKVASKILFHAGEFQLAESDGLNYSPRQIKPKSEKVMFKRDFDCYISRAIRNQAN